MRVAVLTLTWDRLPYTQHCFQRLRENAGCDYDHFVLDQGSRDGTPEWLREYDPHRLVLEDANIGIRRGLNRLLDLARGYDVIIKLDNDCELVQPGTLDDVCRLVIATQWLLSPRILGLGNPPRPIGEVQEGGELLLEIPQIGGIFLAAPASVYERFRYDETSPTRGMADVEICHWFRRQGGRCGYVKRLEAWHYRTTAGQERELPGYFARKAAGSASGAKVAVVTAWHEHHELTPGYWHAIKGGRPDAVLVLDNGSSEPLAASPGWPEDADRVRTVRLDVNAGFGRACNRGLELVGALWPDIEAVLWLNNDIELVSPGWLEPIRDTLAEGVLVGAELRGGPHTSVDGVDMPYLDGWCLGGLRRDLLALGGFDEVLLEPAYYSDVDLCFRAIAAGMALRAVAVPLRHKGNITAGSGLQPEILRVSERNYERYAGRARALLERRRRDLPSTVTVVIPFLVGEDEGMLAESIASIPDGVPRLVARNEGDYAGALNQALRQAQTEFVQFLGHDDRLGPYALELLAAAGADVAYPSRLRFDERWSFLGAFEAPPFDGARLAQSNFVPGVSLVRRSAALAVGGFRDLGHGTHEDWDLWLRMHREGFTFRAVPQAAVHIRERRGSRSRTAHRERPDLTSQLRRALGAPPRDAPLTIVQLAPYDPAGVAWKLHRALQEATGHRSLLFRRSDNFLRYPTQYTFDDRFELAAALAEADIVHVHLESAWLLQLPRDATRAIHHHGSSYRARAALHDAIDRQAEGLRLVSSLELAGWAPDLRYLPTPVLFDEWSALARGREQTGVFRLAHSPASARRRPEKGTAAVVRAVDELRSESVAIELVLIEGRPWEEALRLRASCDATFDSFWLGMQSSGCEAACMGQPVVAGDAHIAAAYERYYGAVPYTFADERTVKEVLRRLATDAAFAREEQQRVERHVRTHHDLGAVASRYLELVAAGAPPRTSEHRLTAGPPLS